MKYTLTQILKKWWDNLNFVAWNGAPKFNFLQHAGPRETKKCHMAAMTLSFFQWKFTIYIFQLQQFRSPKTEPPSDSLVTEKVQLEFTSNLETNFSIRAPWAPFMYWYVDFFNSKIEDEVLNDIQTCRSQKKRWNFQIFKSHNI